MLHVDSNRRRSITRAGSRVRIIRGVAHREQPAVAGALACDTQWLKLWCGVSPVPNPAGNAGLIYRRANSQNHTPTDNRGRKVVPAPVACAGNEA
jgi:hypothetical protein